MYSVKNLAVFCCYIFLCINLSAAGFLKCSDRRSFTSNSSYAYGNNLDLIFSSLPDNVARNGSFYVATIGEGLDRVHAMALCRGDSSPEACSSCVSLRIREIQTSCLNQTEAFLWEGEVVCLVRYTDRSIFGMLELQPSQAGPNPKNVVDVISNVTQFNQTWDSLMDGLVERASNGSSRLKFATGIAQVESENIHALMQCTPDLSRNDCRECLMGTVGRFQRCCQGKQGGYVLTPNCYFRWALHSFFNSSADTFYLHPLLLPPPPPPLTATNRNTSKEDTGGLEFQAFVTIVVPIIISMAILGFACVFLQRRKKIGPESTSK